MTGRSRDVLDAITTLHSAAVATADGALLDVEGLSSVLVQFTGSSPVGTITFEGSLDGTTFVSVQAANVASGVIGTTTTAVGNFVVAVTGLRVFRARISAFTSGTFTVKAQGTPAEAAASLVTEPVSGTVTANQGTAGSGAWPVKGAGTAGTADTGVVTVQGIASGTPQPVSSTTLATVAKQPALGTAGTASADVISVQGVASMTPVQTAEATNTAGTLTNTADATVDGTSGGVSLIASNANRKALIVQNVGSANIRVGTGTLTATTGIQLVPGDSLLLTAPFCPTAAIKAIRETSTSSTAAVAEIA